jgi:hypothetical protein
VNFTRRISIQLSMDEYYCLDEDDTLNYYEAKACYRDVDADVRIYVRSLVSDFVWSLFPD